MAKIKVSEKTVAQLRKGTMAGNLAKAKNASPEMREALIRFYGAKRVNAAGGNSPLSSSATVREGLKKVPGNANDREGRKAGMTAPKPSGGPGAKMSGRPAGGPGAKMVKTSGAATPTSKKSTTKSGGTRVNKPLINVPAKLGSAQAKLDAKAKANAALYAKQQKAAQDKKKQKNK